MVIFFEMVGFVLGLSTNYQSLAVMVVFFSVQGVKKYSWTSLFLRFCGVFVCIEMELCSEIILDIGNDLKV